MGFLTGFDPVFRWLRPNLRRSQRMARDGEVTNARIAGIRVKKQTDQSPDLHEWALEVRMPRGGVERRGCRQRLSHAWLEQVRLGDEVRVRVDDDGGVLIDAEGEDLSRAQLTHKVLDDPPADGIEDENVDLAKERRKAVDATITVLAAQRTVVMGVQTLNTTLDVSVLPAGGAAYETRVTREEVPFYAQHLVAPGTVLPGTARLDEPGKVRIDWPAAAVATPGRGIPPALERPAEDPTPSMGAGGGAAGGGAGDWSPAGLAAYAAGLGQVGGITFEQWVAVTAGQVRDRVAPGDLDAYAAGHGIPAGAFAAGEAAWSSLQMSDPRVGAAYGAAFETERKR